uniref:Sidoreflexin n=1 Tax=Ciona savignyi TaxID=51511 RepID=H2YDI0_CIOSA
MTSDQFSHLDLSKPRWPQDNYTGRAKHFSTVTNPLNVLLSSKDLDAAKKLVTTFNNQEPLPPGTTEQDLWKAKYRYDSAFHPDTKEKMLIFGRMSAQVPMNMTITGCMLTFYRTTPAIVFWQWTNQSFNAIVNYTNRSGDAPLSTKRILTSYACATTGAVGTALALNSMTKKLPALVGRFVPFAAVACANCINIPLMRSRELTEGITVTTKDGEVIGESKTAAKKAIVQVTVSRIGMAVPGMVIPPIIMNRMSKGAFLKRFPLMNAPIQVGLVGLSLIFATPLCCALFPQQSSIATGKLEQNLQHDIKNRGLQVAEVYFNKGL